MKLVRLALPAACFVGVLGSVLAFAPSASAQTSICTRLAPGDATCTFNGRPYRLHVPASYTGTRPVALVLDLHGFNQTYLQQVARSGFLQKSDEVGFVYAAPGTSAQGGIQNNWNSMGPCCGFSNRNDTAFLRNLTAQISTAGRIDANQIFVTGFSNGAAMSHTLA